MITHCLQRMCNTSVTLFCLFGLYIKCSTCVVLCIAIYTVVLVVLFTSSLDEFSNRMIHQSNHQRSDNNLNHTHWIQQHWNNYLEVVISDEVKTTCHNACSAPAYIGCITLCPLGGATTICITMGSIGDGFLVIFISLTVLIHCLHKFIQTIRCCRE